MTTIETPASVLRRDHWGRPLIKSLDVPGKETAFTRVTTVAGTLDERTNLEKWKMRMVATGLARRPDLIALAASHPNDRDALNKVTEDALDAAGSDAAANVGTAVHAFCHVINKGGTPEGVPAHLVADLAAYVVAMSPWEILHSERMVVLDDLQIAGTPDAIVRHRQTGQCRIADIKTGASVTEYAQVSIASQLAMYSRGALYHHDDGSREPLTVDQHLGLVIHLPAGKGVATLWDVDLDAGWDAVSVALQVRGWRKRKNLFSANAVVAQPELTVPEQIAAAGDEEGLLALYRSLAADGRDMAPVLGLFSARKAMLRLEGPGAA